VVDFEKSPQADQRSGTKMCKDNNHFCFNKNSCHPSIRTQFKYNDYSGGLPLLGVPRIRQSLPQDLSNHLFEKLHSHYNQYDILNRYA
jgi:hypothetical protein